MIEKSDYCNTILKERYLILSYRHSLALKLPVCLVIGSVTSLNPVLISQALLSIFVCKGFICLDYLKSATVFEAISSESFFILSAMCHEVTVNDTVP